LQQLTVAGFQTPPLLLQNPALTDSKSRAAAADLTHTPSLLLPAAAAAAAAAGKTTQ
jgi:hypothetical protein